jgi:hypothetical protein
MSCSGRRDGKEPGRLSEGAVGDSLDLYVWTNEGGYAVGETVIMRLIVRNRTDRSLKITFPTQQRFDFIVKKGKKILWQWSGGMLFAQVTAEGVLTPGDSLIYETSWDQRLADGTSPQLGAYTVHGILKIVPETTGRQRMFGIVD